MPRAQSGLRLLLACSLVTLPLAGCGQLPTGTFAADTARVTAASVSASEMARRFAEARQAEGHGKATVQGAVVTLTTPEGGSVRYDFTRTPQTAKVTFRAGEYVAELEYQDSQVQAWRMVWVAVRMIYGGTKAHFWYLSQHTGSAYNREDHVKAVVYGMISQGVAGLPGGFLWKYLVPIVWKWILGEAPIKPNQLFNIWLQDKDAVIEALRQAEVEAAAQR